MWILGNFDSNNYEKLNSLLISISLISINLDTFIEKNQLIIFAKLTFLISDKLINSKFTPLN